MRPPSIVIIDHESETRDLLMHAFESRGYMTWTCPALEMANALFLTAQPDVVLINLDGDVEQSLNFLQAWKKAAPRTQVIVQAQESDAIKKQAALDRGALAYLTKPVTPEVLFKTLSDPVTAPEGTQQPA